MDVSGRNAVTREIPGCHSAPSPHSGSALADLIDDPAAVAIVEGGAEHVPGLKRDHVQAGRILMLVRATQSGLRGSDEQGGLRRIALHLGSSVLVVEEMSIAPRNGSSATRHVPCSSCGRRI
jgi:hypothetical protein